MLPITKETIDMINILPEDDQELVNIFVKKLVLAWDPDYTKLTSKEKEELDSIEQDSYLTHDEVWK